MSLVVYVGVLWLLVCLGFGFDSALCLVVLVSCTFAVNSGSFFVFGFLLLLLIIYGVAYTVDCVCYV